MMSDASEMLAAALEQMDGIIAGSKAMDYSAGLFGCQSPVSPCHPGVPVLLEELRGALTLMDPSERLSLRGNIPDSTAQGLVHWLTDDMTNGHHSSEAVYQERLSRLESDKECLLLQVSVLSDQVEVQGEKMRDLDQSLDLNRQKLIATEELLQQEQLNRSTMETQKLQLMTEVSGLKRDNQELLQEVTDLRFRVTDMENERLQCEKRLRAARRVHGNQVTSRRHRGNRGNQEEVELLQEHLDSEERRQEVENNRQEVEADRDPEVLKMKSVVESLASANDEKERRIKELEESLIKAKKIQAMVKEKLNEEDYCDITDDDHPSLPVSVSMETESIPHIAVLSEMNELDRERQLQVTQSSADVPQPSNTEQVKSKTPEESFGSKKSRSSFGRGFFKLRTGRRSGSSPNLAETEQKGTDHLDLAGATSHKSHEEETTAAAALPASETKKKSKGFMKFFGRLKRSHSTSFTNEEDSEMEFRRGGVRATAGPRLQRAPDQPHSVCVSVSEVPFSRWSREEVCVWLHDQGLGLYVAQAHSWIKSGQTILQASQHDLEKELCMKQPLHRKKLRLALQALGSDQSHDPMGGLDHNWVTRWLDDIGLPQYKSHFDEARVDGRMLHYMTVEDLLSLKVGSVLHHLSLKRGVQVLRLNHYQPDCLRRRPSDQGQPCPGEVSQWTNHRVMEWLRSVDLAEYAPNLRGSGVHGGLMVLEPRFNVEALALLLNIPPNKTLLRRHLATHFHLLVGSQSQRSKQEGLENPDYTVLTATAKVKPRRLSFGSFGTLRRKRNHDDGSELVCPLDEEVPQNSSSFQGGGAGGYEEQLGEMEDSEGTVRQIGAFSDGINNLTIMLEDDAFYQEIDGVEPNDSGV